MNKEVFEISICEISPKRLIYAISVCYLLARSIHVAAELDLGKIIKEEPQSLECIYDTITRNIGVIQKDYLHRFLKYLAQYKVINFNEEKKFFASDLTNFLISENTELIVNQSEWCQSSKCLDFLIRTDEVEKLLLLDIDINFSNLEFIIKATSYNVVCLLSSMHLVSRALHTVSQIEIINFVSNDRKINTEELCFSRRITIGQFEKLMNILSLFKLVEKEKGDFYISKLLYSVLGDSPETIQPALSMVDEAWWNSVSELKNTLFTRQSAFERNNGMTFFKYLETHPEQQRKFDQGLGCFSKYDDELVASKFSFSHYKSIVDIGGGYGGLLWAVHEKDGAGKHDLILCDQPHVLPNIHPCLKSLNPKEFKPSPCDLFDTSGESKIPKNKNLYVIKGVLHDFNDEECALALRNIHEVMSDDSHLLVIERSLQFVDEPNLNYSADILMLILLNGHERSMEEWLDLYKTCGFYCNNAQTTPIAGDFSLMLCSKQRMFAKTKSAYHDLEPTSQSTNEYSIQNN